MDEGEEKEEEEKAEEEEEKKKKKKKKKKEAGLASMRSFSRFSSICQTVSHRCSGV